MFDSSYFYSAFQLFHLSSKCLPLQLFYPSPDSHIKCQSPLIPLGIYLHHCHVYLSPFLLVCSYRQSHPPLCTTSPGPISSSRTSLLQSSTLVSWGQLARKPKNFSSFSPQLYSQSTPTPQPGTNGKILTCSAQPVLWSVFLTRPRSEWFQNWEFLSFPFGHLIIVLHRLSPSFQMFSTVLCLFTVSELTF